ncbi:hypothetical protein [Streptomyces triticisoli]|nr:hypothetical protein [Streptomyces triticisoli]
MPERLLITRTTAGDGTRVVVLVGGVDLSGVTFVDTLIPCYADLDAALTA